MRWGLTFFLAFVLLFTGAFGGGYAYVLSHEPTQSDVFVSADLMIAFPELGNQYTGDCTYIKAGDNDILIDAGSKPTSIPTIAAFLDEYVADGTLEYVIVTHAHEDHYAGFATFENAESLFDRYECGVIIDFAQITAKKSEQTMYKNYIRERTEAVERGAVHYTAKECVDEDNRFFDLGNDMELEVLPTRFYDEVAETENDHSVCVMLHQGGERHFLFTGDLEKAGEKSLVELNDLPEVDLYKAGHHGSKTSSNDVLMKVIKPDIVTVAYGTNDWSGTVKSYFHPRCEEFFAKASKIYPDALKFAILPIWRADAKSGKQKYEGSLDEACNFIAETASKYGFRIIDARPFLPQCSEFFWDGRLHPNDLGFADYARGVIAEMEKYI